MNLVRCRKCGTVVTTKETLEEKMQYELSQLNTEVEKITNAMAKYPMNTPKWLKLLELRKLRKTQAREIRDNLFELRKIIKAQERNGKQEFFAEILIQELKKHGYTKDNFKEFNRLAEIKFNAKKNELNRIYGDSSTSDKNNDWHNSEGQYDPTAKLALEKMSKEG